MTQSNRLCVRKIFKELEKYSRIEVSKQQREK